MQQVLEIPLDDGLFKVLSSDSRRDILRALLERRMTGTEIANRLGLGKPATSEHLKKLVGAGLVERHDDAQRRWVYFSLSKRGRDILEPKKTRFILLLSLGVGALLLGAALGVALTGQMNEPGTIQAESSAGGHAWLVEAESFDPETGFIDKYRVVSGPGLPPEATPPATPEPAVPMVAPAVPPAQDLRAIPPAFVPEVDAGFEQPFDRASLPDGLIGSGQGEKTQFQPTLEHGASLSDPNFTQFAQESALPAGSVATMAGIPVEGSLHGLTGLPATFSPCPSTSPMSTEAAPPGVGADADGFGSVLPNSTEAIGLPNATGGSPASVVPAVSAAVPSASNISDGQAISGGVATGSDAVVGAGGTVVDGTSALDVPGGQIATEGTTIRSPSATSASPAEPATVEGSAGERANQSGASIVMDTLPVNATEPPTDHAPTVPVAAPVPCPEMLELTAPATHGTGTPADPVAGPADPAATPAGEAGGASSTAASQAPASNPTPAAQPAGPRAYPEVSTDPSGESIPKVADASEGVFASAMGNFPQPQVASEERLTEPSTVGGVPIVAWVALGVVALAWSVRRFTS